MPERVVVCNTSPLLYLHQVSNLELFAKLYGELTVPPAVESELRAGQERGIDVPVISEIEWIRIRPPSAKSFLPALVDLGPGEAEVIALGLEFQGSLLVLDDQLREGSLGSTSCRSQGRWASCSAPKRQVF